ncbi:prenyltransferase [Pseudobythopirellula maris]|uniref:Prenyltransferase n=1 Tax=Pseudobythopirellula maris TaxID=2527991 RepID=A0A5C5ZTJ4_9BACT|nr:UbiA family prenyltransferase [Pseudobythopirellula maris]TWT90799.1 prenyltransferase [Pseudobythopirellula maris]
MLGGRLADTVRVSRPGFWITHLWFYLLPLGGRDVLAQPAFWLGAIYATAPLGHLLYGWNDLGDEASDRLNPRKGNLLFGARPSDEERRHLPRKMALVQAPFWALFLWLIGPKFLLWAAAACAVNWAYNNHPLRLKSRPLFDLANQTGYLLVFVLSSWLNEAPLLAWPAQLFGALFAMHSHLLGQIADVEPDRAAGRQTTAVWLGAAGAKLLTAALLLVEAMVVWRWFDCAPLAWFLALAGAGFAADRVLRGGRLVSDRQLAVVFIAWNIAAVASAYWVWRAAVFVE